MNDDDIVQAIERNLASIVDRFDPLEARAAGSRRLEGLAVGHV